MIGDILQPTHLLFILVIALLVLGPKRLPEVGRALGRGLRDFRNALNTDELRDQMISTTSMQPTTPSFEEPTAQTETLFQGEPVVSPAEEPTGATVSAESAPEAAAHGASPEPTSPASITDLPS